MNPVLFDLETRSLADLRAVGGRVYADDPSTSILCACWLVEGVYHLWVPVPCGRVPWPMGIPEAEYRVHTTMPDVPLDCWVAHNADEFDARVWRRLGPVQPREWKDSLPRCRLAGLPGALDALSERFLGVGKSKQATKYVKEAQGTEIIPPPGKMAVIGSYCIADVAALAEVWKRVESYDEAAYAAHRACNDRGVRFDRALAGVVLSLSAENVARAKATIEALTGGRLKGDDLTRRKKVLAWCETQGVRLGSLRRELVEQLLDNPDAFLMETAEEVPE